MMLINANRLKNQIIENEGCIEHMYLDTRGYVTVAVGHLIADVNAAEQLPFRYKTNQLRATLSDIRDEYYRVKHQPAGMTASSYASATILYLTQQDMDQLLDEHIEYFHRQLLQHFTAFDQFPEPAQEGIFDMAFNLGVSGLIRKFPTFVKAAKNNDWTTCAKECRRRGIGSRRNEQTKRLFLSC